MRTSSCEVRAVASLHALPRVGLIVPKHRHNSVERNRLKRQLRELLRLELLPALHALTPPLDVVVRVAPVAYSRSMSELRHELEQARVRIVRLLAPESAHHPGGSASTTGGEHER